MKLLFLKMVVIWRRLRHGLKSGYEGHVDYAPQIDKLMRRANPEQSWHERANWMIDIAEWIRYQPKVSLRNKQTWKHIKHQRVEALLDWLDVHREERRVVQSTLRKTLREANGPELFSATGLSTAAGFFSEFVSRVVQWMLPKSLSQTDLSSLFMAMFPDREDAEWLLELNPTALSRLWRLSADDGISHMYWQQIDEALVYLMTVVVAEGISPAFRQRLEPKMPLKANPFMALRREMEKYLSANQHDEGAVRGIRMLIAVCRAQTDRIYAHLDEYGVSVNLVYRIERMRSQLARMGCLIDLRAASDREQIAGNVQTLLGELISAYHNRFSVDGLVKRSFALLGRKIVERHTRQSEHVVAHDRAGYRAIFKAGCIGGVALSVIALGRFILVQFGWWHFEEVEHAYFFEGAFVSINYALGFLFVAAIGGVLAARQPAVTAPILASKMGALDTNEGIQHLMSEIFALLRSQVAGVLGNGLCIIPTVIGVCALFALLTEQPLLSPSHAVSTFYSLSVLGVSALYAVLTGVLLWLSSLIAGYADNWFALHRVREALTHQRRLVYALGVARAQRWAEWCERHVALIVGNVSLGVLFGMVPVFTQFFGLHTEIRHVTLALGRLMAAATSLGWESLSMPAFWLGLAGIVVIGILNVGVAFVCALMLALRARNIPGNIRHLVYRRVLRGLGTTPQRLFVVQSRTGPPSSSI